MPRPEGHGLNGLSIRFTIKRRRTTSAELVPAKFSQDSSGVGTQNLTLGEHRGSARWLHNARHRRVPFSLCLYSLPPPSGQQSLKDPGGWDPRPPVVPREVNNFIVTVANATFFCAQISIPKCLQCFPIFVLFLYTYTPKVVEHP